MEQLLQLIRCHFDALQDRLIVFDNLAIQCEGWFKGELLTFLSARRNNGDIQGFNREVRHNGRRVDLEIHIGQQIHRVELKHWRIGVQGGNEWTATSYFGDAATGIEGDVRKLSEINGDNSWLLIFTTKNPGHDDWNHGIETFNNNFAPLRVVGVNEPQQFPDYYFCGLLKVEQNS